MTPGWRHQQERGTRAANELMVWIALKLGRSSARALLPPICLYYTLLHSKASRASRCFLTRVLNRHVGIGDIYRTFHYFASTLLDRVFLLAGESHRFDVVAHGAEALLERVHEGQGCILFGSHLGSFEIARAIGFTHPGVKIKVLMHQENTPMVNETLNKIKPELTDTIIPTGSLDSMLLIKECLESGGLVGILCDRAMHNERTVSCKFLGQSTNFPSGPVLLASILQVPVFLFFGLYKGGNRYELWFEPFADRIDLGQQDRLAGIRIWTERYVERLEHYCRLAPYNWFNFYEFWDS